MINNFGFPEEAFIPGMGPEDSIETQEKEKESETDLIIPGNINFYNIHSINEYQGLCQRYLVCFFYDILLELYRTRFFSKY